MNQMKDWTSELTKERIYEAERSYGTKDLYIENTVVSSIIAKCLG